MTGALHTLLAPQLAILARVTSIFLEQEERIPKRKMPEKVKNKVVRKVREKITKREMLNKHEDKFNSKVEKDTKNKAAKKKQK